MKNKKVVISTAVLLICTFISTVLFVNFIKVADRKREALMRIPATDNNCVTDIVKSVRTLKEQEILRTDYEDTLKKSVEKSLSYLADEEDYLITGIRKGKTAYSISLRQNTVSAAYSSTDMGVLYYNDIGLSVHCYTDFSGLSLQRITDRANSACVLPGQLYSHPFGIPGRTTMLADHNYQTGYKWANARIGDTLYAKTPYGQFIYKVTRITFGDVTASGDIVMRDNGQSMLGIGSSGAFEGILFYTCYPWNRVRTSQRYVVFAQLVGGTVLS